jgi:regulator of PEP synthase PpsR (kinase-PPPase family)
LTNSIKLEVFFVSDRTGITAESLGRSLLTQFENRECIYTTLPYIDTQEKLSAIILQISNTESSNRQTLVFSTLSDKLLRQQLLNQGFFVLDLFSTCLPPLQSAMKTHSSPMMGEAHGMGDQNQYLARMDAVNFALNVDDGLRTKDYQHADIILVGVSRSGKTPTCLYLAMQFGIRAANYPLVDEDLESGRLPAILQAWRSKLYGLAIDPVTLQKIRHNGMPDSKYASIEQCRKEINRVSALYAQENITVVESSSMSVEELATTLMQRAGLKRQF